MSYEIKMNMIPDVHRAEEYPLPAGLPNLALCQQARPVMEDHLQIHYVGDPAWNSISGILAFCVSWWNTKEPYRKQDFIEQIRLMRVSGKALSQLADAELQRPGTEKELSAGSLFPEEIITAGGSHETMPQVLSDGTVLFLSDASVTGSLPERSTYEVRITNEYCQAPQLYAWKNGQVRQLTHMLHGVNDYQVSPDEKKILFSSFLYYEHDTLDNMQKERTEQERAARLAEALQQPIIFEQLPFKSDAEYGYCSRRKKTLWLLSLPDTCEPCKETPSLTCLMDGSLPFSSAIWSPDSESVTYSDPSADPKIRILKLSVTKPHAVPLPFASVSNVCPDFGASRLTCLKDGSLLFPATRAGDSYSMPRMLCRIPAEGGMDLEAEILVNPDSTPGGAKAESFNLAVRSMTPSGPTANSDGSFLFITGYEGSDRIYRQTPGETPACLTKDFDNFSNLIRVRDGLYLGLFSDALHLPEVALIITGRHAKDTKVLPLTDLNPWLRSKELSMPISFHARTLDWEEEIQGWCIPPLHTEAGQKVPALLYVHGGPSGYYCTAMNLEFQALAAAGYYVIFGNPRGGSGYGYSHGDDDKAYGAIAMNDLICLVDKACSLFPEIDEERIGITGGSYGGYATIWGASHSRRYKAASAIRPLANLLMIGTSSQNAGGMPGTEEAESFLDVMLDSIRNSPNSYADRITIPFQILQSELDANCVPDQMHQLFTSIRDLHPDLPCRMVLYPDSNHGLLRKGPMYLAVMQMTDNLRWFEKYL